MALKPSPHGVRSQDDHREPDQPLEIVHQGKQEADGEVRTVGGYELRKDRNVKRADLRIKQVRGEPASPGSPEARAPGELADTVGSVSPLRA